MCVCVLVTVICKVESRIVFKSSVNQVNSSNPSILLYIILLKYDVHVISSEIKKN